MNVKRQEPGALVTHAGILCGGCWVTGIPTATHYSTVKDVPQITGPRFSSLLMK